MTKTETKAGAQEHAVFARAFTRTLKHEGLWSDHPDDRGGATMMGITLATFTGYRRARGLSDPTAQDLRALTPDAARAIYVDLYWLPARCDRLVHIDATGALPGMVFDMAVNHGPGQAGRDLQQAANALGAEVKVDGRVGPRTLAGVRGVWGRTPYGLLTELAAQRGALFSLIIERDPNQAAFRLGWHRRNARVLAEALLTLEGGGL